jgi:hypothetical protein
MYHASVTVEQTTADTETLEGIQPLVKWIMRLTVKG